VRLARDLIVRSSRDPSASLAALESLHEVLLGPARRAGLLEGVRRLVLVPHRILNYVPFAALRDPATGRYLAQDYAIFLLPSAGALAALRGNPASAAPVEIGPTSVFAPLTDRLIASRDEAEAVARALRPAAILLGTRASERAVRLALGSGGLVHLATHADLSPRTPLFSGIELAPSGDRPDSDGRLDLHEILGLRIGSSLVFLSGCETALGASVTTDFVPGEDYATLARAFLYAGARNVIATLWRVEDQGAAEFATRFYRHYPASPPPEALALAQRDMLADVRYRMPYYWAGYVLNGEGR
jgi:CHAT domain-containing protein